MAAGSSVKMRFARADELSRPASFAAFLISSGRLAIDLEVSPNDWDTFLESLYFSVSGKNIPILLRRSFAVKGRKAERYIRIAQEDLSVKLGVCLKRRKIRGDTGRNFHRQISLTGRNVVQPAQEHIRIVRDKSPAGRSPCAGRQGDMQSVKCSDSRDFPERLSSTATEYAFRRKKGCP